MGRVRLLVLVWRWSELPEIWILAFFDVQNIPFVLWLGSAVREPELWLAMKLRDWP